MPKQKITRRADGRIQKSKMIDGKRRFFYGDTVKEVDDKIAAALREAESGVRPCDYTVAQWCEKWLDVYASKGYSVMVTHKNVVAKLCSELGHVKLTDVRHADIQAFAKKCGGYAKTTVDKIRGNLNAIFDRAVYNQLLVRSPCNGVDWDYKENGTHRALNLAEIALVTRCWDKHWMGFAALMMLYTGLRRGELLALRWSDIDTAIHVRRAAHFEGNKPVEMPTTKTMAGQREIPILPQLAQALENVPRGVGLVFRAAGGGMLTESAWKSGWAAYNNMLKREGAEREIRSHDLRHTYATILYDAGIDVKSSQYLLGHANVSVTMQIYTHLSNERKAKSVDALLAYADKMQDDVKNDVKNSEKPVITAL